MKSVSVGLAAHLAQEATTLATIWKVARKDGTIYGFTDHVDDLVIGGVTYVSSDSYSLSTVQTTAKLNVDNLEITGFLSSSAITEADVLAGRWDYAAINVAMVNYADLSQGTLKISRGWLGEVTTGRNSFVAELRGMMQAFTRSVGELYSASCRADLGDARCGVALAGYTVTGSITGVTSNQLFADSSRAEVAAWFDYGLLTWTSGANIGLSIEIKTYSPGSIEAVIAMPFAVAIGDTYSLYAGCGKRFTEDCKTKFNNVVNFRGEPHIPGYDSTLRTGK